MVAEREVLITREGFERRDDEGHALLAPREDAGGDLVDQGFSATGGHDDAGVLMALKDVGDGGLLDGQQFAIVDEGIGEEIDEVFFGKCGEDAVVFLGGFCLVIGCIAHDEDIDAARLLFLSGDLRNFCMIGYAEVDEGRELGGDLSGEIAELFAIFCEAADGVGICGIVGLAQK